MKPINRRLSKPLNKGLFPSITPNCIARALGLLVSLCLVFTLNLRAAPAPITIAVGMSGGYYIGSGGGTDFSTISEAIDSLESKGMDGNVWLYLEPETYNEQVLIDGDSISGLGQYRLYLRDDWGDPVITYAASSAANNGTLLLRNCNNVDIDGLTFRATGTSYNNVVRFDGHNKYITLESCSLIGVSTTFTSDIRAVVIQDYGVGDRGDTITIQDNYIRYGSKGIIMNGGTGGNMGTGNPIPVDIPNSIIGVVLCHPVMPFIGTLRAVGDEVIPVKVHGELSTLESNVQVTVVDIGSSCTDHHAVACETARTRPEFYGETRIGEVNSTDRNRVVHSIKIKGGMRSCAVANFSYRNRFIEFPGPDVRGTCIPTVVIIVVCNAGEIGAQIDEGSCPWSEFEFILKYWINAH